MSLGHKQRKLLKKIEEEGFIVLQDVQKCFNINREKALDKVQEFEFLDWIERDELSSYPVKWVQGKDYPL